MLARERWPYLLARNDETAQGFTLSRGGCIRGAAPVHGHVLMVGRPLRGELLLPSMAREIAPPDYLSLQAREHWGDLVRALVPAGLMCEVDVQALAMLSENLADYWGTRATLRDMPPGNFDADPEMYFKLVRARADLVGALGGMDSRIRAWLSDLLLTPYARARAQPARAMVEEQALDLSALDADERAALREMIERRGEQRRVLN